MKILEDYCSDNQYAVSIKEDTAYLCLHSPKTTKETRSNTPYPEEGNTLYSSYMEIKYSGRYQMWSLLQEIPNTPYPRLWIRRRYDVSVPALTKDHKGNKIQYVVSRRRQYAVFKLYGNKIFWKISNVAPTQEIHISLTDLCVKRSSTKELFTPFKDPKREFRSSRKHFKTLSLDESRSPDFDLFSDQEEYSEEEVTKTMTKTMEQYMSKTRADNGSGVARPKIEDKDNFELKSQFLKELRDNTFSGSDNEDANEHIEKVLKIVDLFHILNITIDQVMLRAFLMSLTRAASRWLRNKPSEIQEVVLFYNGLDVPTRQILDSRGAIPSKTTADAKVAIQEMAEYSQKWHNGTSRTRSTKTSEWISSNTSTTQLILMEREIKKVN
ncbi:hypothetical protein Tco_0850025 [Tanacetum coccineum]